MKKTEQLLAYLIKNHSNPTVTSLMKLSYLIDLVNIRKTDKRISNFEYTRYMYGPFDYKIYNYLRDLIKKGVIFEDSDYTLRGDEYIIYRFNEDNEHFKFNRLTEKEKDTIDEVLDTANGLGAKALTELAYRTKPMKKINARIGDTENLNVPLDLKAE